MLSPLKLVNLLSTFPLHHPNNISLPKETANSENLLMLEDKDFHDRHPNLALLCP